MISAVRRFNRLVTQRLGALDDRYLARERPLGEARLLWEIGAAGGASDVRTLRARLGLDSGYLSRLLGSLARAGLVEVRRSEGDRRVRTARITRSGAAERRVLDRRSDALAGSLLEPLDDARRRRLVAAMRDVERLLSVALVDIAPVDPEHPHAQHCLRQYFAELDRRFRGGFDPARSLAPDAHDFRPPAGLLLVATLRGEPIGCGALKLRRAAPAEIKRLWVAESARGLGVGRRLLAELEAHAAHRGSRAVRLDTNETLREAIAMYRSAGYVEVPPFNDEPYAHHWFEKQLNARRPSGRRPKKV